MVDITHKKNTLREATAQAIVKVGSLETIEAIRANQVPKGNVFEMAKTAGLFAVKRTSDIIPDCHPLPIEYTGVEYTIEEDGMVNVAVYDINGRMVAELADGYRSAGSYPVMWDARELSSGVYMLHMTSGDFATMQKVMLIK